ncbi:HAAS signaling domain-containing protein [Paractinoplanes brasiliensis]|uniref:Uncharacterized protein n=1 Tax=Paractinoplanes brasiliensis TaxID=52695 RepID=A0A4R6JRR3_9ACTN|nr:hypothetical protein [Actinoplanes brasiliensis]TDO39139.1 hypothetical protein C8E87_2814 [Actinoplanes brasiliensis]
MKTRPNDVVTEYLHEVDQRLAGLPVLQRRELLADLEAHIAAERAERNLTSEGELIEVLERLGSPETVAAAAHEEAGTRPKPPAPPRRFLWPWLAAGAGVLLVLLVCLGVAVFAQSSTSEPAFPSTEVPASPAVEPTATPT